MEIKIAGGNATSSKENSDTHSGYGGSYATYKNEAAEEAARMYHSAMASGDAKAIVKTYRRFKKLAEDYDDDDGGSHNPGSHY